MVDFSFTKDFRRIVWGSTLLIGFERSLSAGLVWFVVGLLVPELISDPWAFLFFPITYFILVLPVGLILSLLNRLPSIGWVFGLLNLFWALLIVVGDPLVFLVHKIKPEIVPVESYGFLNFQHIIFVLKPEVGVRELKYQEKKEVLWTYETDGTVFEVSFSPDGSLIAIGSGEGGLYALDRSGKCLWSHKIGDSIQGGITFSADGSLIAVGSADNRVYLFNRFGELQWSFETGNSIYSAAISADGSVVATGSNDGKLYLLNRSGELLWDHELGQNVRGISLPADGAVVVSSVGSPSGIPDRICLFDRSGDLLWSHGVEKGSLDTSMSADGSLIAAIPSGGVCLFGRSGEILWNHKVGIESMSICISSDGSLIIAGICVVPGNWRVFAYDRSGQLSWGYKTGEEIIRQISITDDNSLVAAVAHNHSFGKAYLFNRSGELLWSYELRDAFVSVSISTDGALLTAGSTDRQVYLFDVEEILLTREP